MKDCVAGSEIRKGVSNIPKILRMSCMDGPLVGVVVLPQVVREGVDVAVSADGAAAGRESGRGRDGDEAGV